MEEGIAGSDVGQEGVAQALTLGRALDEAGDVHHVQEGRDFAEKEKEMPSRSKAKCQECLPHLNLRAMS